MISQEEKDILLADLEEEDSYTSENEKGSSPEKPVTKTKPISATAIFAAGFVFFIFIIILLIFILSLSGSGNPIFQSFGIEPYQIKEFLTGLVNNIFMGIVVLLLLFVAIGIFRGYSLPKEQKGKRRGSFIFGGVSGGLIFLSILAWGGAVAFIDAFATEGVGNANIEILGIESGEKIIAPVDISFSASDIVEQLSRQGYSVKNLSWSKNNGKTFSSSGLNTEHIFQFFQKGVQTVTLEVELITGEIGTYTRTFLVDDATFSISPSRVIQGTPTAFDASLLYNGSAVYKWDFDNDGIFDKETRSAKTIYEFDDKGAQTVNLRIESSTDSVEKYSREFIVYTESSKSLDAIIESNSALEGKSPLEITFDGGNSFSEGGDIVKYEWKFGNSTKKQGVSITHVFSESGNIPVTLTITDENGKKDIEAVTVTVEKGNSPPNAVIVTKPPFNPSSKKLEGYIPLEVTLYGTKSTDADENIVQYEWIFTDEEGNEEKFYGDEAQKIFRQEGEFTATLRVTDGEGESSEEVLPIIVREPPVVPVVSAFPESGTAPLIVEFNASQSTCKLDNCKILSYEWDFGDTSKVIQSGAFVSHQFTEPGTYEVETTAITNIGERATVVSYISVTDQPFVACFRASRTSGTAPLTVSFDPTTCSKGNIVQYKWDFGDGFISGKRTPTHTFSQPGEYTVLLNTFDKNGRVSEMKEVITVMEKVEERE